MDEESLVMQSTNNSRSSINRTYTFSIGFFLWYECGKAGTGRSCRKMSLLNSEDMASKLLELGSTYHVHVRY